MLVEMIWIFTFDPFTGNPGATLCNQDKESVSEGIIFLSNPFSLDMIWTGSLGLIIEPTFEPISIWFPMNDLNAGNL